MSRKNVLIYTLVVALIAALIYFRVREKDQGFTGSQGMRGGAVMAEVLVVKDSLIAYEIQAIGTLRANEEVDIVSELEGKITGIHFKEGTAVIRNQLLFKLDDSELLAARKKLETELVLLEQNESRYKILKEKGGTSQQEYEEILNRLQTARADLELLNVQLAKTEIRAPFNGQVGLRRISLGAFVNNNSLLTTLSDVSRVKVDFTITERYAALMGPGHRVSFTVENDTATYEATVIATDPAVNENTRSLMVRAIATNTANRLVPGSSAKVSVSIHENSRSIMVPTDALIPRATGYNAFVLKNGKAELRSLRTGFRDPQTIQVLDGLAVGDSLLTTNLLMLRPDVSVQVIRMQ